MPTFAVFCNMSLQLKSLQYAASNLTFEIGFLSDSLSEDKNISAMTLTLRTLPFLEGACRVQNSVMKQTSPKSFLRIPLAAT